MSQHIIEVQSTEDGSQKMTEGTTEGTAPVLRKLLSARWSDDPDTIAIQLADYFKYTLGRRVSSVNSVGMFLATATSILDRLIDRFNRVVDAFENTKQKSVCYLSLEYLIGRSLSNAMMVLDLKEPYSTALKMLGFTLEDIESEEVDAALGNGGLGRLAACFIDSMASLNISAIGYGIRYRYGLFKQLIEKGFQVEKPDHWLRHGDPWEIQRYDITHPVHFYGTVEMATDEKGTHYEWTGTKTVLAMAYDMLIPGYATTNVVGLRLWQAESAQEFELGAHEAGDYWAAVGDRLESETLSAVLYPNNATEAGRELRLKQEYFLVSASMQDILQRALEEHLELNQLPDHVVLQLNDTHPVLCVPELMRLLMDEYLFEWDAAWAVVSRMCAYTNHTVLPEALETWPECLLMTLIPRIMNIIAEIDRRWSAEIDDRYREEEREDKHRSMGIICDGCVHMARVAVVTAFAVNGVAAIHTEIIKRTLFRGFAEHWPGKFLSITNGVTPRRWLCEANPQLSALISRRLAELAPDQDTSKWPIKLELLEHLRADLQNSETLRELSKIRAERKHKLAELIERELSLKISEGMLFDVQVKRIHEYKRQLLNALSVVRRHRELKQMSLDEREKQVPRLVIIAGKAASSYTRAKQIIKLIHSVAETVNNDPDTNQKLMMIFIPNYGVTLAEIIVPGSDINEQISTAGTEASGTSNMKFIMNGVPILGTLDGATVEIRDEVGCENIFIFGLTTEQVDKKREELHNGQYIITDSLKNTVERLYSGEYGDCSSFRDALDYMMGNDYFLLGADFDEYHKTRWETIDAAYSDQERWQRMMLENIIGSRKFTSDRAIAEYAERIWHVSPISFQPVHEPIMRIAAETA